MKILIFYVFVIVFGSTLPAAWADDLLTVRFLDVGYADAILLQFPDGRSAMIDTGGTQSAEKVTRVLRGLGISRLDFVVLTHPHENHYGGLHQIRDNFDIRQVYVNPEDPQNHPDYFALLSELEKASIPVAALRFGEVIEFGGGDARLRVLHPQTLSGSTNEDSMSLLLTYGKTRFWFTADIQPEGQEKILRNFPEVLDADCVQIPFHGGKLSEALIAMAKKKICVLSTGANEYKKPYEEYLDQLRAGLLRTDRDGDIVLVSDGLSVKIIPQ